MWWDAGREVGDVGRAGESWGVRVGFKMGTLPYKIF